MRSEGLETGGVSDRVQNQFRTSIAAITARWPQTRQGYSARVIDCSHWRLGAVKRVAAAIPDHLRRPYSQSLRQSTDAIPAESGSRAFPQRGFAIQNSRGHYFL